MDRDQFDERAATWDDESKRKRAERAADCIRGRVPLTGATRVLEYGCGTGLLSFALRPSVGAMVLADSSSGMLEIAREKIRRTGDCCMQCLELDLTTDPPPSGEFDLVCSLMALHHVVPLEPVLGSLAGLLVAGGHLCVADLVEEDGSFHGEGFHGHHGFSRERFGRMLGGAGIALLHWDICMELEREHGGHKRSYPVFMATAQRT